MQNNSATVVILGTGGTIAGTAASAADHVGYRAGQIGVGQLVAAVPALAGLPLEAEQVAQLDSKDMDHATWQKLAQRAAHHLARPEVAGLVITHGTDTLEETAWFLHRVLAPAKPVVLTAAMRPATALAPDGPQNLLDAVTLAQRPGARGVLVVLAGRVHGAAEVRKHHGYQLDAFDSGDAGPLARIEEGQVVGLRDWPTGQALGVERLAGAVAHWPKVALLCSHAGADEAVMTAITAALLATGVDGVVVEGTGNGTVHRAVFEALLPAAEAGVPVWRTSRCQGGGVVGAPAGAWPAAGVLTPAKARVDLMLQLLARRTG